MLYEEIKKKFKKPSAEVLLLIIGALFLLYLYRELVVALLLSEIFWFIALIAFFVFILRASKTPVLIKLKDYERAVIFRFGKFNRIGGPGWTIVVPFIESYTKVDLRVKTLDVEKQDVITKDSIQLKIDAVIYLRVKKDEESVARSVLEVENFEEASKTFVVSLLRDIVGGMTAEEVIANIDKINEQLYAHLAPVAEKWGLHVTAVQIKDVDLPEVVLNAMHRQKAAVQEKLARLERAEAQKIEINAVKEAAGDLSDRALNYYYIKALEKMSDGKSTKIIFPLPFTPLAQSLSERLSSSEIEKLLPLIKKALDISSGKEAKSTK